MNKKTNDAGWLAGCGFEKRTDYSYRAFAGSCKFTVFNVDGKWTCTCSQYPEYSSMDMPSAKKAVVRTVRLVHDRQVCDLAELDETRRMMEHIIQGLDEFEAGWRNMTDSNKEE